MRLVAILVEIGILVLVLYLVFAGATALTRGRRQRLPAGGRWQARHYADQGYTVVAVSRMTPANDVLEEHVVARILDADDEWSRRFLLAKQEAEERAFHLNADGA